MKPTIVLALLFGATAIAQEQWEAVSVIDEFDDSVSMVAALTKDDAAMAVLCKGNTKTLSFSVLQSESMQSSASEEIAIRFDDEEPEVISVTIARSAFVLASDVDSAELARKLTRHGKFRLRYADEGITLVFEYDEDSAKEAIGKVLEHCNFDTS